MKRNGYDCYFLSKIAHAFIGRARLLHVGRMDPDPGWTMKAHSHPFHEMIIVLRGRMEVVAADERIKAGAGDVMWYPAGVAHAETSKRSAPAATIFISFAASKIRETRIVLRHDATGRIRQVAQWMHDEKITNEPERALLPGELLPVLLSLFFQPERRDDELRTKIRDYVRPRVAGDLTLDELAGVAKLSRFHFTRTYRAQTGRTPMADVRSLRAEMARDLLLATSLPIKEVAPKVGLGNEYALSRVFMQEFKMRPGAFRQHVPHGRRK